MNIHEYQAKELLRSYRVPTPRGEVIYTSRGRGARRRGARRQPLGGEGPDPCGGPREGGRGEDREHARRDGRDRGSDARLDARDRTDGQPRTGRESPPGGTGGADRTRVLPLARRGPRLPTHRGHRERRGRRRHRGGRGRASRCDPQGVRRPGRRAARLPMPEGRDGDRPGQPHHVLHAPPATHLPALPRQGLPAPRDQPVHRDRGRRAGRARLQDELRRQRAVPPGPRGGAARLRRGGPEGGRGHRPRPELHRARRLGGLHRERCRPRDGDDGRDRAPRGPPRELPGRRGRCEPREDRERLPHRVEGPQRARDPREHLRGHQPVRLDRAGRGAGHAGPGDPRAGDRAPRRDQRGGGPPDPRRERPDADPGRRSRRRGLQGGRRGRRQEVPA